MNEFAIGAQAVAGGFVAWFRKAHKCDNEILNGKGGHPIVYPTRSEAKAAAGEAIIAYINGSLVRDGAMAEAQVAADALFVGLRPFVKQRGKARLIEVERRAKA
ncbi:hypothetical protein [Agrobacterium vitis]|uniref:hypothetical protein n=1 Tax=Agrobacterium vitis TaxID=373 RepID=UPI001F3037B7|nr:hypothetical protein [Agrobacterium vitis]